MRCQQIFGKVIEGLVIIDILIYNDYKVLVVKTVGEYYGKFFGQVNFKSAKVG